MSTFRCSLFLSPHVLLLVFYFALFPDLFSSPLLSSITVLDAVLTLSVLCFDVMSSFICSFYNSLRPLEMRSTISIQCQVRV